jgi:hypothetical protein
MSAPVHLVTVVGGTGVAILPHALRHYQALGVRSFFVVVHVPEPDPAFVARVSALAASCGAAIDSVEIGADFCECKDRAFTRIMQARPDDWFLPIDCDELHAWPDGLAAAIDHCERRGYEFVRGCLVDRCSEDGKLTPIDPVASIWDQYPLGGIFTYQMARGDPRKVVLAKGRVPFRTCGHHDVRSGVGCPVLELLVPVHHFKWVDTLLPMMEHRRDLFQRLNRAHWVESDRVLHHIATHGRIDITDSDFLVAPCRPHYPRWSMVRARMLEHEARLARFAELEPSTARD